MGGEGGLCAGKGGVGGKRRVLLLWLPINMPQDATFSFKCCMLHMLDRSVQSKQSCGLVCLCCIYGHQATV